MKAVFICKYKTHMRQ